MKKGIIVTLAIVMALVLMGCGTDQGGSKAMNDLTQFPAADMSGYHGLEGYDKPTKFVEVTVKDVDKLMNERETFILYTGFDYCPWCNALIAYLNDVAIEEDVNIAYIDTRKNTDWESNTDIEDYDIFKERFGEFLDEDEDGELHLYVPQIFFIKDGKAIYDYSGVLESLENANDVMTEEQENELRGLLREAFEGIM